MACTAQIAVRIAIHLLSEYLNCTTAASADLQTTMTCVKLAFLITCGLSSPWMQAESEMKEQTNSIALPLSTKLMLHAFICKLRSMLPCLLTRLALHNLDY